MLYRIVILAFLLIAACGKKEEKDSAEMILSPGGAEARWIPSDFPKVLLVSDRLPENVYNSCIAGVRRINSELGQTVMVVKKLPDGDYRLNGGVSYGEHTLTYGPGRIDRRADTDVVFIKGPLGDKEGRLFSMQTYVYDNTPDKFMDVVVLHELLHQLGADHVNTKSSIMFISAEASTGEIPKTLVEKIRKMVQGW